ncbi:MAG TPA: ABC transporter permease [Gemmatimonadaceae bacterium]|nr:ABC transporter permease [Gemmatimonadaceae bacterium]
MAPPRRLVRTLVGDRSAMSGGVVLLLLGVMAVAAPLVAPYGPGVPQDIIALKDVAPSATYPFGTDLHSRDVLSRIIFGTRVSLSVAFLSVTVAVIVGTAYGAVAGYFGGRVDTVMMRFVDALLSIPRVLLLIAIATLWNGIGLVGLVLLLGFTGWFGVSRLVRAIVLSAREDEFVTAARALGASDARILVRHILPQAISPVLVAATLAIGNVVVIEAGLSYLGIGVQEPVASWGSVFHLGMENFPLTWWAPLFAGLALVVTVLAVNLVADGLRQALSTRQLPAR